MNTSIVFKKAARGLTLIEMLISLFIFSLIALGSYRVLTASLQLDQRFQYTVDEGLAWGAGMHQLRQDLEHIRYRLIADNAYPQIDVEGRLRFLQTAQLYRDGRLEPALIATQYRVAERDGQRVLLREVWQQPSFDGEPEHGVPILSDVKRLAIEVIDEGERFRRWPLARTSNQQPLRPEALRISWLGEDGDEHQMLVALP